MSKFGYRPKYFKLHELFPPDLYAQYKNQPEYLWRLFDEFVLEALDIVKEFYGMAKVTVNNYYWKGPRKESGLRNPFTKTGAKLSAHKFARAVDFRVEGVKSAQVQADIKAGKLPERFYELINCVELDTDGWTHMARLNYVTDTIVWVRP